MQLNLDLFHGSTYTSECVGFCRRAYRDAVGYCKPGTWSAGHWIPVPSQNSGVYNSPADTQAGKRADDFELIGVDDLSLAQPGDIIENYHHDMIYIGTVNGVSGVIANNGSNRNSSGLANGLITMDEYYKSNPHHYRIWRITAEAADKLGDASTFNADGELVEGGRVAASTGLGLKQPDNMSNFYYNGIPDGKYSVTKGILEVIIDNIAGIFDWLIGLATMCTRAIFVGWTAIIENLIVLTVSSITGNGDLETISVTSTDVGSSDDAITIDKIVFNQMSIFDVNFFNYNDK